MDPLKMFDEWVSNCKESHTKLTQGQNQHEFLNSIESAAKEYFCQLENDENKKDIKSKQLAQLLAKLGPPLSASSSTSSCSKLSALHYILESLNGIIPTATNAGTCTNSINTNICLQKSLVELLGKFLLQYCGPLILTSETAMDVQNIEDDGVNDNDPATAAADYANSDFSEEIRDCATQCISALLKIPIAGSDDINSDVIETEAEVEAKTVEHKNLDLDSSIQFRIQVAQDVIRKRCANLVDCDDDDEEDDDDYNYGQNGGELEREATTLSNLSLLPRSRRSLCFQILNCVIQGIQNQCDFHMVSDINGNEGRACNLKLIASGVIGIMIQFAAFCAHCLHGETDPRCLIQMLKILNRLQIIVCAPLMEGSSASTSGGTESKFPYDNEVLDAVAVYYPVRFTPPRGNDPHGITREGIHSALMDVLCKMSTAAYGISVLFSSCRSSMDQITKDGVSVSFHPFHPYGSQIVQLLSSRIINDTPVSMLDTDGKQEPPFGELKVSAIKSLESVLLSTPALILNQPDEEDTATVSDAVLYLAKRMLVAGIASNAANDGNWKSACGRMVAGGGSTIGKAMRGAKDIGNGPDATLLESDREIISFVQENLFPKILESSVRTPFVNDGDGINRYYGWMVLASACETDQEYAVVEIISNLYDKLGSSINDPKSGDVLSEAATIAGAISHLLTHGGPKAYGAFHAMPQGDQA